VPASEVSTLPSPQSVSVIVTTYNQAAYIGEAVASVLEQTLAPREIVVVDDGSADDTPAALGPYRGRIRYARQENQGVAAARNAGVRMAEGELLAFLDGDDVWEPEKLAVQVAAAGAHPGAGLLVVNGEWFGHPEVDGRPLFGRSPSAILGEADPVGSEADSVAIGRCHDVLLRLNFIPTMSQVMIPRRVLEAVGPSDPSFSVGSDYDLYLRIAARYEVVLIARKLTRWRYVPTSASGPLDLRRFRWAEDDLAVWRKHLALVPPEQRADLRRQLRMSLRATAREASVYGRSVDRGWATRYLARLWRRNLPSPATAAFLLGVWVPTRVVRLLRALTPRGRDLDTSRRAG
jgi:glycosyltransferase involved in cell wall biosynthesis